MKNISLDLNEANLQKQFSRWKAQAVHLCGSALVMERDEQGALTGKRVVQPLAMAVQSFFSRIEQGFNDPETIRQRNEFLALAAVDDNARRQLAAMRVEQYQNYALAHQNIINFFFEQVALENDGSAYAKNETMTEIAVRAIGEDNNARRTRLVKPHEEERIPLIWLATDEVEYVVIDIYKGNVVEAALKTINLGYDMANQREQRAWDLLNTTTAVQGGALFRTSFATALANSNKVLRPWLANSRIKAGNLPTGNDITVQGTSASTKFRTRVLLEISRYGDRFKGVFAEGDLMPTGRILIPGGDVAELGEEVEVGDGNSDPVAAQILQQGYATISYLGKRWVLVPDNTLDAGTCYPEFNRKVGKIFTKPGLDKELVRADEDKNREHRKMRSVFGAYINITSMPFVARFKYKS